MNFTWPHFTESAPLADGRSWVAEFESYDQRTETCYYWLVVRRGLDPEGRLMAAIDLDGAEEDRTGPEFRVRLAWELAAIAATGRTNTTYTGSLASWLNGD